MQCPQCKGSNLKQIHTKYSVLYPQAFIRCDDCYYSFYVERKRWYEFLRSQPIQGAQR
jgi:transposase-like protein